VVVAEVDRAAARAQSADLARKLLITLAVLGSVASITGTLIYCYPNTLGALQSWMVLFHDVSGDLSVPFGIAYLWVHLSRVWKMKRRKASRWSGYASIAFWTIAAATGVWGQIEVMKTGTPLANVHLVASIALVVVACFHGAWGLRPKLR
jgi:hypothetical protein